MATVMGLLSLSFAIWGVGDIFRGYGQSTVATVGHTEITVEQFRQLFNDRLQQVGRQVGRPLTPAQAKGYGLDRSLLQTTIAEATLDETARRMRLGVTDADILKAISSDPNFAGIDGKFDPARFLQTIRQFGYTEQRYVSEQRKVSLRQQIAGTISAGIEPPQAQLEAISRYRDEQRSVSYVRLGVDQAGKIDPPSPEALTDYYNENKALFRAPEYRKATIVVLSPEEQAKWMQISDEDAKKAFEVSRARFETPEKRRVLQIVFPTMDEAKAAREKLAGGLSFADLAKERGLAAADYDLGMVAKSGIIDGAVADVVFKLPVNEVSQPVQGRFGAVLAEVTKIEAGTAPVFETAEPTIKRDLAIERARAAVQDLRNKMEDDRGTGTSVAEAAKKLGLTPVTIEAVDRSGRAPDGKPVTTLPAGTDVLSAIFSSDVGIDSDPLQANGGFVWFDVLGITPSREKTLEEAKDQVTARWHDAQVASRLEAKAKEMLDKINAGAKLADLAAADGLKLETATNFKRADNVVALGGAVIDGAFRLAKDGSDQASGTRPGERIVYTVTDIVTPKFDTASAEAKTLRDSTLRTLTDEQIGQYIAKRESDIGVSINEAAFAQATGSAQN
jgi:peptidyl-prolyl cis-trans isomerase D